MLTKAEIYRQMADHEEVEIEHLRAVLAQPNEYFSPKGGQHWYQVVSRSEIESRLKHTMQMRDYCLKQADAV